MDAEQWERAKELFAASLERDEGDRLPFVAEACRSDEALRREVESLLWAHRNAGSFMNSAGGHDPSTSDDPPTTFFVGQVIARRYKVLRFIRRGGMGEVYEAKDLALGTHLALKTIRPEISVRPGMLLRFQQEIKLARRVTHHNVCRLYDYQPPGDPTSAEISFITMELLEGETLATRLGRPGRMSTAEALPIVEQMAAGLAEAHKAGVVHCDFKPGNVMLVAGRMSDLDSTQTLSSLAAAPSGSPPPAASRPPDSPSKSPRVVITDFGLSCAYSLAPESVPSSQSASRQIVGTPAYMAPEQLEGGKATPATDIYALGLVIYEMVTGHRPFPGDIYERLREPPPSPRVHVPDLDARWEQTILRCLERDPASRYVTTKEVAAALCDSNRKGVRPLWKVGLAAALIAALGVTSAGLNVGGLRDWLWGRGRERISSLAVLPLDNLSGDHQQDYFADGMTDELIMDLAKISALRVISRTSVMQYKGTRKPVADIARALHADAVVEGTVLRSADRVRITAELIDPRTDSPLWAESYERDLRDILGLQSEVARAIANQIRIKVTSQERERLAVARPVDTEAYEAYLKGRYYWDERTEQNLEKAIGYFQAAIEKEPDYARAYAGLADCYNVLGSNRFLPPIEAFPKAKVAALKALRMDDNLGEAHASLAFALWNYDFDWAAVEREYKRAIELDPGYATSYHWYAGYLAGMGRSQEAIAAIRKARELDPLSSRINSNVGLIFYLAREYNQAAEELRRAMEMDPSDDAPYGYLGMVYLQKANYPAAIANFAKSYALLAGSGGSALNLAYAYAVEGKRSQARFMVNRARADSKQKYEPALWIARVYAGLGEKEQAIVWLQKAYVERSADLPFLKVDPTLDSLRADPSFQALLRLMKLY